MSIYICAKQQRRLGDFTDFKPYHKMGKKIIDRPAPSGIINEHTVMVLNGFVEP
jgi:hypothetical protein